MNPDFPFTVYVNSEALTEDWASGIWYGDGATSTNVVDPNATPHVTMRPPPANQEFPTLTIAVVVFATALLDVCGLVVVRKRKVTRS